MQRRARRQTRQQSVPAIHEIEIFSSSSTLGSSVKKNLPKRRKSDAPPPDKAQPSSPPPPRPKPTKSNRSQKPIVKVSDQDPPATPQAPEVIAVDMSQEKLVGFWIRKVKPLSWQPIIKPQSDPMMRISIMNGLKGESPRFFSQHHVVLEP